jgi:hypothetical protein
MLHVTKVDLDVADVVFQRCGCYFRMLRMLFLTCCNRSYSGCNCFSFMFANHCTHVVFVFLRCCKCPMRMFQKSAMLLGIANIKF